LVVFVARMSQSAFQRGPPDCFLRFETQLPHSRRGSGARSGMQPPLELPPYPVGDGMRSQRFTATPCAGEVFRFFGEGLDSQYRAGKAPLGKSIVKLFGRRAGGESCRIDAIQRWIEFLDDRQLRWWCSTIRRTFVHATGQPVCESSRTAEPGGDV